MVLCIKGELIILYIDENNTLNSMKESGLPIQQIRKLPFEMDKIPKIENYIFIPLGTDIFSVYYYQNGACKEYEITTEIKEIFQTGTNITKIKCIESEILDRAHQIWFLDNNSASSSIIVANISIVGILVEISVVQNIYIEGIMNFDISPIQKYEEQRVIV